MIRTITALVLVSMLGADFAAAQRAPYDVFPDAKPPYYRVRYEPEANGTELRFAVNYTIWIPPEVDQLRGVIVHQHGCGEGSCRSGLTGAFDLHWQALARKHDCALLAPAYEQPQGEDCQLWCDPRNGSSNAFLQCLIDLAAQSNHPELPNVPWALWGHSGGGHWAGGMILMHPERVIAAWLRSGVPLLEPNPDRPNIKPHTIAEEVVQVPILCNLGVKEGVVENTGRFAGVWPANKVFFTRMRSKNALIGIAVDPLTSHECGNQRYLAIPWLDACLTARLPAAPGAPLRNMRSEDAYLAMPLENKAVSASEFTGTATEAGWLPNESIARRWEEYVRDTRVVDETPPPAPTELTFEAGTLRWKCNADLESGITQFIILKDGEAIGRVPEQPQNRFGRPLFQNLQYSDTPTQPLADMSYQHLELEELRRSKVQVSAVNSVGLPSEPSEPLR